MNEVMQNILAAWKSYWGEGFYPYLLLVAFLYLLIFFRKKEQIRQILVYVVIMLAVFFCPVTAWIIQKCIGSSVYWRVLWLLPMVPLIACGGAMAVKQLGKNKIFRLVLIVAAAVVVALSGKSIMQAGHYEKVTNYQKVPEVVAQICAIINNDKDADEVVCLGTEDELAAYVRVYDPSIMMPYGRRGKDKVNHVAKGLYLQLSSETPVIRKVLRYAKLLDCNYLTFRIPNEKKVAYMEKRGFHLIGQVEGFGIFRYDKPES